MADVESVQINGNGKHALDDCDASPVKAKMLKTENGVNGKNGDSNGNGHHPKKVEEVVVDVVKENTSASEATNENNCSREETCNDSSVNNEDTSSKQEFAGSGVGVGVVGDQSNSKYSAYSENDESNTNDVSNSKDDYNESEDNETNDSGAVRGQRVGVDVRGAVAGAGAGAAGFDDDDDDDEVDGPDDCGSGDDCDDDDDDCGSGDDDAEGDD